MQWNRCGTVKLFRHQRVQKKSGKYASEQARAFQEARHTKAGVVSMQALQTDNSSNSLQGDETDSLGATKPSPLAQDGTANARERVE